MASTGTYAPDPDLHVVDANGLPVSGGLVWTYIAGTTTPVATYTDVALTTPNPNPIVAGSDGRFVAVLAPGNAYKFVYETAATPPAHGAVLATRDNITAIPLSSPSTDITGTAGELLTQGQVVYLSSGFGGKTPGFWYLADADFDYASSAASLVGIVVNTALAGTQVLVRLGGQIAIPGVTLTAGTGYWVSQTAGAVTGTAPPNPFVPPPYLRFLGSALDAATLALTVPAFVALTAVRNTFTTDQMVTGPTFGRWLFQDQSRPADQKTFSVANVGGTLILTPVNDALTGSAPSALIIDRANNIKVGADIYEKARTTPFGHWIDIGYSGGNFSTNIAALWTVDAGDVGFNRYTLIGKTMIWHLQLSTTSVSAPCNSLCVAMPPGLTIQAVAPSRAGAAVNNGAAVEVVCGAFGSSSLAFNIVGGATWAAAVNTTSVSVCAIISLT